MSLEDMLRKGWILWRLSSLLRRVEKLHIT